MEGIDVETAGAVDMIDNTFKLLLECQEEGEVLGKRVSPSIYMVPRAFRNLNPSCFIPKVVSIGPLHRQDEHLQGFEVQKKIYLHNWLRRLHLVPERTLRVCAEKVIQSIQRIKACYGESINNTYNDFELAKMMVIDACFILEFIQSWSVLSYAERILAGSRHTSRLIIYDMLLIENQIPFFVLEIIIDCTAVASGRLQSGASLTTYIEQLLPYYTVFQENLVVSNVSLASSHDHILAFVHKCYQPSMGLVIPAPTDTTGHSAMDLDRAGVNFKPYGDENWAMAMKVELPAPFFSCFPSLMTIPQFSWFRWPTLKMPVLTIDNDTELILRNLIIYEQYKDIRKYVTSYVVTMDWLIDTPEDVTVLVRSNVLFNYLGSNVEAANMINALGKEVISDVTYDQHWKEIDDYYNSYWPNTIAGLKRTYFNNPWNIIALFAAFILFGLTITQTIFTIKAAYPTNVTT